MSGKEAHATVGAAAHKRAQTAAPAQPALRLVRGGKRHPRRRADAAASRAFRVAVSCLAVLALAGVARVSLAARAAEASIDAWELRAEVRAEQLVTRGLEADRSTLASPSRIEAVASETLNMQEPTQVSYLQLPEDTAEPATAPTESPDADGGDGARDAAGGVVATLMDLAASEAQVMLVGDAGLGSLR